MTKIINSTLVLFLTVGVSLFSLQHKAQAVSCDAIVGDWAWFSGGNVTLTPEGTITSKEFGNLGSWECTNTTTGVFTLRWVFGTPPFVDTLSLSADGQSLSGKNQYQYPVTANRISTAKKAAPKGPQKDTPEDPQDVARLKWKFDANYDDPIYNNYVSFSPMVADGVVYVMCDSSSLCAIETESGQKKWAFQEVSGTMTGTIAVADGMVYVSNGGGFYALDIKTGQELWRYDYPQGTIMSQTPTVTNGVIYFGAVNLLFINVNNAAEGSGNITALDSKTGKQKRSITIGAQFRSAPTVADNFVYAGNGDGTLYAVEFSFDTKTRRRPIIWSFKTGKAIVESSPAVAGGVVYVGSDDGYIYAIDIGTRKEKWKFKTGGKVRTSPAVADGVVYVGSGDNNLYALDAMTGQEKWRFKTGGISTSSPVVADGVVYIGSTDTYLYAVNAKTGREKWKFKTGGKIVSSPAVADNVVYIGSADGYLYAIEGLKTLSEEDANRLFKDFGEFIRGE